MSDPHYKQVIKDLQEEISDLRTLSASQEELIAFLEQDIKSSEEKSKRLHIWNVTGKCTQCTGEISVFVAALGRRLYSSTNYFKLKQLLRKMGIFVKEISHGEKPPKGPYSKGYSYDKMPLIPLADLWDMKIPDGVGPEIDTPISEEGSQDE